MKSILLAILSICSFIVLNKAQTEEIKYKRLVKDGEYVKGNFFFAEQICKINGLEIPTPDTEKSSKNLKKFMDENNISKAWISLTDLAEEGKFFWLTTAEKADYTDWHSNQPDNAFGTEDCVEIVTANEETKWNDLTCDRVLPIICENGTAALDRDIISIFGHL